MAGLVRLGQVRRLGAVCNSLYQPGLPFTRPQPVASCTRQPCVCAPNTAATVQAEIAQQFAADRKWSNEELEDAYDKHTLMTWGVSDVMKPGAIRVAQGDGVYLIDNKGKRFLDFNAMAMCSNLGHTVDPTIIAAVTHQLQTVPYAYPGAFLTDIRAQLSKLLATISPGDLNTFIFPSGGTEANETAIRLARLMTKRHKIFTKFRSYHGATAASLSATGDYRRLYGEQGSSGFVRFMDPYPYGFSFGATEEEVCERSLAMLREHIEQEGPSSIAAVLLESVTGTNGVLLPPKGYLKGLRSLCDEHGILIISDEVMAGFGRTGKIFGFCHEPDFVPDMFTFAKGVNAAYIPLGGVGLRDHVAAHFKKNAMGIGSTYNSHPVALASAYAALKVFFRDDVLGNVQRMEPIMKECMNELAAKHPSIKQTRVVGLFGCIDIQKNRRGEFLSRVTEASPLLAKFKAGLLADGVFTMMRGHNIFANPPLIINEAQLREGFKAFDKHLKVFDDALVD
eukprot:m.267265 g.267265  ORF g.267265 m.267265 type:complete len:509 (+) comp54714_c0_seq3:2-1528(+)